jgi:hypothetical protein
MNSLVVQEEQINRMGGDLLSRLAQITHRPVNKCSLTLSISGCWTSTTLDYVLIEGAAQPRRLAPTGLQVPDDT